MLAERRAGSFIAQLLGTVLVVWKVKLSPILWASVTAANVFIAAAVAMFLLLQQRGKLGEAVRWLAPRSRGNRALASLAREFPKLVAGLKAFISAAARIS
jgi:hypothetical protein